MNLFAFLLSYISSYARKRGEHLATKADLDQIMSQVKSTTELTEGIRNDIEHQVWRKQQIEAIKRDKLEEYLVNIYSAKENLRCTMRNQLLNGNEQEDVYAKSKADMLQSLYFPELKEEHSIFLNRHADFDEWLAKGLMELVDKRKAGDQIPAISHEHMSEYPNLLNGMNAAVLVIEQRAADIAANLNKA